jgi:hypothetical protein
VIEGMADMAKRRVIVKVNPGLINAAVAPLADLSAKRAADRTAQRANQNVRSAGRVRTGKLASSYKAKKVPRANGAAYSVGSDLEYAGYQEEGIGPVHAAPGRVLAFVPKGSGVMIFRPRTSGFRGAHQLVNAYKQLSLQDYLP